MADGVDGIDGIDGVVVSGIVLRTFRFAPSPQDLPLRSIPPRLTARCLPLTAAGGQGPQDNTAYDHAYPLFPSHHPAPRLHVPPPAYGRGWPGSSGQHRLRPCISTTSFTPPLSKAARTASRLRPRVARVLRATPLTTMHIHSFLHTTPLQGCTYRLPLTAAGGQRV